MKKSDILCYKNITLEQAICGGKFLIHLANSKTVKVNIAPGMTNGQIIRLRELGHINDSGERGDLLIRLLILDHPLYQIKNADLHAELVLTHAEAQMGAVKTMPGPDGKNLRITVPPQTKSGHQIRLQNKGVQGKETRGDIIFNITIDSFADFGERFYHSLIEKKPNIYN